MKGNNPPLYRGFWSRRFSTLLSLILSSITLAAQVLPPPPLNTADKLPKANLFVRAFEFQSNTVFTAAELSKVTDLFTNRELSSSDLEQARRNVSLYYVSRGYINSGAVIPDQDPTNGVVVLRIVEGRLSDVRLQNNKWLRDAYITNYVERWGKAPLNLPHLQEGLQLLRQNPNVKQVNAELRPGTSPGESVLDLKVTDQQPFRFGLQFDNERPPSVGSYELWALASDLNLTGNSDPLNFQYGIMNAGNGGPEFSGAGNMEGNYLLPLNRFDTTVDVHFSRLNTSILEDQFGLTNNITSTNNVSNTNKSNPPNFSSLTSTYGVALRHPVYQTANDEVALSLGFDWRKNTTWISGHKFNLSPGAVNGEMVVSKFSFSQEWVSRRQDHVLALRSTFNVGVDILGATDDGSANPNGKFFYWLGQGQYVQRLFKTQNQLILRVNGQWSAEPLLALEQLSVGGAGSVRGYLENQLVRDRGIIASAEFRIPVLFDKAGAGIVQLAPFFDYGGAWNVNRSSNPNSIYSVGTGLLITPNKYVSAELYWGYRLRHVNIPDHSGAQGEGFTFKININAF